MNLPAPMETKFRWLYIHISLPQDTERRKTLIISCQQSVLGKRSLQVHTRAVFSCVDVRFHVVVDQILDAGELPWAYAKLTARETLNSKMLDSSRGFHRYRVVASLETSMEERKSAQNTRRLM